MTDDPINGLRTMPVGTPEWCAWATEEIERLRPSPGGETLGESAKFFANVKRPGLRGEACARAACQACGGRIEGWICQHCGRDFEENDAGDLVFMATGGEAPSVVLSDEDRAWAERKLRRDLPVGHCGESTSEAIERGRAEDRVDRILAALSPQAGGDMGALTVCPAVPEDRRDHQQNEPKIAAVRAKEAGPDDQNAQSPQLSGNPGELDHGPFSQEAKIPTVQRKGRL